MAEPRKSKPRLTLRDLASVEVPAASVADVLGKMNDAGALGQAELDGTPRAASMSPETPTLNEGSFAPSLSPAKPALAKSGPVSTRQLEALPEGVSPEIAAMLGLPEASSLIEPEPEPEATVEAAEAPSPEPAPVPKSGRGGLVGGVLLVAAAAAAALWFGTRPPVLDGALFETSPVTAIAPSAVPDVLVAFLPIPAPVVVEPTPAVEPPSRGNRDSRPARTEVREEDLF
jgi:hypothetical protein